MKLKLNKSMIAFVAIAAMTALVAQSRSAKANEDLCPPDVKSGLFTSATLGPLGTTTVIDCMSQHAEVDAAVVEREAIEFKEEQKIANPSKLGGYALRNGFATLDEAADDVLENGVRQ